MSEWVLISEWATHLCKRFVGFGNYKCWKGAGEPVRILQLVKGSLWWSRKQRELKLKEGSLSWYHSGQPWSPQTLNSNSTPPKLGGWLKPSVPQFPHLQSGDGPNTSLISSLGWSKSCFVHFGIGLTSSQIWKHFNSHCVSLASDSLLQKKIHILKIQWKLLGFSYILWQHAERGHTLARVHLLKVLLFTIKEWLLYKD